MIPVRGPTLFDRQFNEFVHGVQSKSGNNPAVLRSLTKKKQECEDAKKKVEEAQAVKRKKTTTKASVFKEGTISSKLKKKKKSLAKSGYESSDS